MTFKRTLSLAAIAALAIGFAGCSDGSDGANGADAKGNINFSNFVALELSANKASWDAAAPWKLPVGFTQEVVSDETDLNIYPDGLDDWHDMNVVNETGANAGRYMYRTHEVRLGEGTADAINNTGGAVSVVDLQTGKTTILAQSTDYTALDGIAWTPWETIVFAEETAGGSFFEVELNADMVTGTVHERPAVGYLAHEGIQLDAEGNVYVVDEHRGRSVGCTDSATGEAKLPCGGGIYKFVPDNYGDLSSGSLYVLGFPDGNRDGTGQAAWLGPIDPANAREAGTDAGGASYQRPEDLQIANGVLYAAITEGPRDEYGKEYYEGRVLAIDLKSMMVTNFAKAGVNAPVELGKPGETGHQSGFDSVDNLALAPNGDIVMVEDNKPSDIWFASPQTDAYGASKSMKLFASLTDPGAEGTGIYFNPTDPKTLYVNIQHSEAEDGDGTWAIRPDGVGTVFVDHDVMEETAAVTYTHYTDFNDFVALDLSANKDNWNAASPWKLPEGYTQRVVSDETDLNIYPEGRDDWHDMNVVNETGANAGRYMYRTHEVRLGNGDDVIDAIGGAVSVVDLQTGTSTVLAQSPDYTALDGIAWTPWETLVFAEETAGGSFFEVVLNADMITGTVTERPAVGYLAHEGIQIDAEGNVYVVDEHRGRSVGCTDSVTNEPKLPCGGGIYKFVPHTYGDLSSGNLYVLGFPDANRDGTGQGAWLGPIDPANAREAGTDAGGASYQRPEDLQIIDGVLYAAITEGPRDEYGKEYYEGRVIAIDLDTMMVTNFAKAGVNAPVEMGKPGEDGHQTGFDSVDNLAKAPNGDLVMVEDNKPSDIWFASTQTDAYGASKSVKLFASLRDPDAEGTGIYFSPTDPQTLYVNIQHSASEDGDATWAITKQ